jgi:putative SOS response-associated peptidase YedK
MCGRFVVASSPQLLTDQFDVQENTVEIVEPNYNIAPRQQVMVVRQRDDTRVLSQLRWGLVPSWAKTAAIGDRMINARAEGLATKPAYKRAFEKHRCLIPADGFYEWQVIAPPTTPKGRPKKQPVFVHRRDGEPMAFAGLWAAWKVPEAEVVEGDGAQASVSDGDDGWLRSCVIVTTPSPTTCWHRCTTGCRWCCPGRCGVDGSIPRTTMSPRSPSCSCRHRATSSSCGP